MKKQYKLEQEYTKQARSSAEAFYFSKKSKWLENLIHFR